MNQFKNTLPHPIVQQSLEEVREISGKSGDDWIQNILDEFMNVKMHSAYDDDTDIQFSLRLLAIILPLKVALQQFPLFLSQGDRRHCGSLSKTLHSNKRQHVKSDE